LIWFALFGGLVGLGLAGLGLAFVPVRPSLSAELARLEGRPLGQPANLPVVVGAWLMKGIAKLGRRNSLSADLAICGREPATWGASVASAAILLGGFGFVAWLVAAAGGLHPSPVVGIAGILVLALIGMTGTVTSLWAEAAKRRQHFERVVTVWLRLTNLAMAAGVGLEEATQQATEVGSDWALMWIREVLAEAGPAGSTVWKALDELGRRLEVRILAQVAASLELAGTEGARARRSMQALATSSRDAEMAEAKAEANRVSQRLFLPAILVVIAYMMYLGAPALHQVSGAL